MKGNRIFNTDLSELESLYQRYTMQEIAGMFNVNAETVRKRVHEYGIPSKPACQARRFNPPKEELNELYQTKSLREIAEYYGVGETIVHKRVKEHGIVLLGFENGGHRAKTGKVFTEDHKTNLSNALRNAGLGGEGNPRWKGGKTEENLRLRRTGAYKTWKKQALERAGNACNQCGVKGGSICECCGVKITLHVHHIKSFSDYPEIRFDPENSEVLCPKCHKSRHK